MRRSGKKTDRLALALLVGALIGFVVGLVMGFSSSALDAPVVMPFAGAAVGVLVVGIAAGLVTWITKRRAQGSEPFAEALDPARFRQESRQGWVDGIDLASNPPPRPPPRQPRL